MHRIRQLILAGTAPPACFTPATPEIAQEYGIAKVIVFRHFVDDLRDYIKIREGMATRLPPWGDSARLVHDLRAFTRIYSRTTEPRP